MPNRWGWEVICVSIFTASGNIVIFYCDNGAILQCGVFLVITNGKHANLRYIVILTLRLASTFDTSQLVCAGWCVRAEVGGTNWRYFYADRQMKSGLVALLVFV